MNLSVYVPYLFYLADLTPISFNNELRSGLNQIQLVLSSCKHLLFIFVQCTAKQLKVFLHHSLAWIRWTGSTGTPSDSKGYMHTCAWVSVLFKWSSRGAAHQLRPHIGNGTSGLSLLGFLGPMHMECIIAALLYKNEEMHIKADFCPRWPRRTCISRTQFMVLWSAMSRWGVQR